MKKIFTLLFILTLTISLSAQTFKIEGLAKNQNNETLPFSTIALCSTKDSTLVKANIADENGGFKLSNIGAGQYFISVHSVGFQKFQSPAFTVVDKDIVLPSYVLKSETKDLKEVVIRATKPVVEVLADKTVFNVQSTLSATGTNAFELLRKAPGVIIDNNDNLMVEGKTGVQIFIDGKPSVLSGPDLISYLKTLQASDIEAVEIITQPSSRYDAAGTAGIVNIRLKKDKRFGTNGALAMGYGYGVFGKVNGSISINNRGRKTNFFGTYSNRLGQNRSFMNLYRQQANTIFDLTTVSIDDAQSHNAKAGMDYFINSKSTFGVILNGNFNNGLNTTDSRTPIRLLTENTPNQVLMAQSITDYNNQNVYVNSNYRFADTLGHVWNMDLDYGIYAAKRLNDQPNYYFNGDETIRLFERVFQMNTPTNIRVLTLKSDYEQRFLKGKLGLGIKVSYVKTNNQFDFYDFLNTEKIKNEDRSNRFEYAENINAGYLNYNRQWEKVSVQAGLRVEQTISDGNLIATQVNKDNRVKRDYTDFFPSGGITYQITPKNSTGLTYSRRIERPNYRSLNPFEWKIDELSYGKGNAFLRPQYTHNVKLSHTYNYTWTTSLSYSYTQNFFAQITDTTEGVRNFIMTRNIANEKVINLGVSYPFQANKWWNVYASLNAFRSSFEAVNEKFTPITQTTLSFYGQNTFTLPKQWSIEVSGWYSSPSVWGGTYLCKSLGSLDVSFQKKILDGKISLRLAFSDLFFTSPWRGDMQYGDLKIKGTGGWESRQVRLNVGYNFGNNQVKLARNRKTGLEDEKGRID